MTAPELPTRNCSADELTTLVEMLDHYRGVLIRKASGLNQQQLAIALAPSDLTLGRLVMHMALVEDHWFQQRFLDNPENEPWASADWDADADWEMTHADTLGVAEIMAQYDESVARSRAALGAAHSLDQIAVNAHEDGTHWNLRWIMVHLIEEYARHCGHADFIRQSIDGATGD